MYRSDIEERKSFELVEESEIVGLSILILILILNLSSVARVVLAVSSTRRVPEYYCTRAIF
jgi:hypothetical protein